MLPPRLLRRLSDDPNLPSETRGSLSRTAALMIALREEAVPLHGVASRVRINDCQGAEELPGVPVDVSSTNDLAARRVADTTAELIRFYRDVFGRDSIDGRGCDVESSIHYSRGFCNAYWSSGRMVYGDGDGYLFNDFTQSDDFVGHELSHGVTEAAAQIGYADEYGALNESLSDVFGVTFKHWRNRWTAENGKWRVGSELIAPPGLGQGWECIRDISAPGSAHCLNRQPQHFDHYIPGGDPHENSGIPNFAYYLAARGLGGEVWRTVGQIWYATLVSGKLGTRPSMRRFARETIRQSKRLFPGSDAAATVGAAWNQVGVAA